MASEELIKLKTHLSSLEAFLNSPAHRGFIAARQTEIEEIEATILDVDPVDHEDEIEHYKYRGERRCLKQMLTVFTDAADELRDRISDLEDEESDVVSPNEDRYNSQLNYDNNVKE